jgi:micrococcal nuclease
MFNKLCCCIKRERKTSISYTEAKKYLKNVEYRDTEAFVPPIVYGKVIKVYDGDTITVAAKLPFKGSPLYRFSVRLHSIDSPEIRGDTPTEKALAIKSRDALHRLIFGKIIELRNTGKEKYGRLLANIYLQDLHVNKWMLEQNLAVPYDGGKKKRSETWD